MVADIIIIERYVWFDVCWLYEEELYAVPAGTISANNGAEHIHDQIYALGKREIGYT